MKIGIVLMERGKKMAEHGRLIDADALEEQVEYDYHHKKITRYDRDLLLHYLDVEMAPTIELERKKGKWIENDNGTFSCNLCHSWIPKEQHYYADFCLYCGADMRGGDAE